MNTPRYAYDRELLPFAALLPAVTDFGDPKVLGEMRGPRPEIFGTPPPDRDDVIKLDRMVPGRAGDPDVPIRIYTPKAEGSEPRGCVFEIHGGGFMMGSIAMMDPWCQVVAARHGAVVVSVEYRLAPEHPFPAGIEDCYAALCWLRRTPTELGVDPIGSRVGGQSAGGGLAAGSALLARDRGGPALCFQLLDIPELDDRLDTPSHAGLHRHAAVEPAQRGAGAGAITSARATTGPTCRRTPRRARHGPLGAPAGLRLDDGVRPAARRGNRLRAAHARRPGVQVELHSFPGTFHGSALLMGAEVSQRAAAESLSALGRALRRTAS